MITWYGLLMPTPKPFNMQKKLECHFSKGRHQFDPLHESEGFDFKSNKAKIQVTSNVDSIGVIYIFMLMTSNEAHRAILSDGLNETAIKGNQDPYYQMKANGHTRQRTNPSLLLPR